MIHYILSFHKLNPSTFLLATILCITSFTAVQSDEKKPNKTYKILHVMSYHTPWIWTEDQLKGFKHALSDLAIEYKVFEMDTKRKNSEAWKSKVGMEARELIHQWKPDLVYTNDDNAQKYVSSHFINSQTPFVFSGVNAAPKQYGFVGSQNITGVLEEEHFIQTMNYLKKIVGDIKKIAIVIDDGPTWPSIVERIKNKASQIDGLDMIQADLIHTFEEYKRKMKEYHQQFDAVGLLGIFTFKDKSGNNVPFQEVLKWTASHSTLPDFSFWRSRIPYGTLCSVTVSGYEQGLAAGQIARGILTEQKPPSSYPMRPTVKGQPVINMARARQLGLRLKAGVLLSSEVINRFAWEE